MNKGCLIGLTVLGAIVLLVSGLPWVTFRVQMDMPAVPAAEMAEMRQFMREAMTIHGWNGHVTLFGLTLPNWLVIVAAVAVTVLAWLRTTGTWDTSPKWGITLSVYCIVHLGVALVVVLANPGETRFGPGLILTFLASIGMLVLSILGRHGADDGYASASARNAW